MKKKFKISTTFLMVLTTFIMMSAYTNAKYYSKNVSQIWETNFAKFNVVDPGSEKLYYSIAGQSSDNEQSMFDNDSRLVFGDTQHRWTNWMSTGENKGEDVTLALTYVSPVTISKMRIYYFVDHQGCDLPLSMDVSYVDFYSQEVVKVYENTSLNDVDKNFEAATDRTSIFREFKGTSSDMPRYYMDYNLDGVKENTNVVDVSDNANYDYPYSLVCFDKDANGNVNRITTQKITIVLHTAPDWYMGLTEIAIDWRFIYDEFDAQLGSSYWYGKL